MDCQKSQPPGQVRFECPKCREAVLISAESLARFANKNPRCLFCGDVMRRQQDDMATVTARISQTPRRLPITHSKATSASWQIFWIVSCCGAMLVATILVMAVSRAKKPIADDTETEVVIVKNNPEADSDEQPPAKSSVPSATPDPENDTSQSPQDTESKVVVDESDTKIPDADTEIADAGNQELPNPPPEPIKPKHSQPPPPVHKTPNANVKKKTPKTLRQKNVTAADLDKQMEWFEPLTKPPDLRTIKRAVEVVMPVPKTTSDKDLLAVREWLKNNLNDPHWEEVCWWPAINEKEFEWNKIYGTPRMVCRLKFRTKNRFGALVIEDFAFVVDGGNVSLPDPGLKYAYYAGVHGMYELP